jgi:N4-(beta-N-acetylglucosaminyl)-L-asparaginase
MAEMTRRDFVATTTMSGLMAAADPTSAFGAAPAVLRQSRPVIIASANGHRFRNGGTDTCVERAFRLMTSGTDVLDALIAGVGIVELDPEENSVGYGGLPNADGVVQLDACCMHGPRKRAGGVAALEGVRTPAAVAKAVMDHTDHHLLVGTGAQTFARQMGFTIEDDLNTPRSRQLWLEWKRRIDPEHFLDPAKRAAAGWAATLQMVADSLLDSNRFHGTITSSGLSPRGELAGVTSTSGLAWKIPGRVGDSPILGAGLYVDGAVGAAGSTGRGEANLYGLCSFLVVESLRRGMSPKDAGLESLRRVQANTVEKRLLNARGAPNFNLTFYVLNAQGAHAGVALYSTGGQYAVCTENGAELRPIEPLLPGAP